MKLEPEETPDSYKSIRCIKSLSNGVKVFKNITEAREVFYHVAKEPSIQTIESPEDIVTLHAFAVGSNEAERAVRQEAILTAKSY